MKNRHQFIHQTPAFGESFLSVWVAVVVSAVLALLAAGTAQTLAADSTGEAGSITIASLLDDMTNLANMPEFPSPAYTCRQFSSYNRESKSPTEPGWFANQDRGRFLRVEDKDGSKEYVMMDAEGPGAIVRIGLWTSSTATCLAQTGAELPQLPELNWEKRSDWIDVTKDVTPAAVGDGVADDTEALETAFDMVRGKGSPFSTLYFPPGTYRITQTIDPERPDYRGGWDQRPMHIRGHGRSSRIVWDGTAGGTMFRSYSASFSTYIGIVWDGQGTAAEGFIHDGDSETKVTHQHVAFMNFTEIGCGTSDVRYLESSEWRNCLFVNCGKGLAFPGQDDYILTVDGCEFHDNGYGIWAGKGNFYARNCHFQRSKQVDMAAIGSHPASSMRRCTSVGSRAFLQFGERPSPGSDLPLTIQDCHVSSWTNPDWAVCINRSGPLLIFDCVFTDPPSASPPVSLGVPQPVLHSNNRTSTAMLFGGKTQLVTEVPKGKRGGSITSAQQRFFKSEAAIPTKVFDARREFGAAGNGRSDDTAAVQRCIDAARMHGEGAIAYLPRGRYKVSKTINIAGGDYFVGGAGVQQTTISWGGNEAGPMILVSDPRNVRMEYLDLNGTGLRPAVRQVSTTQQPSRMHYEHVTIIGDGFALPHTFAGKGIFEAVGLSKGSVLTAFIFNVRKNGISFENCCDARILLGHVGNHSGGVLRIKGTQGDREGFVGILTGHTRYRIEDNQSLVASDTYIEQMGFHNWSQGPYVYLAGSPTLPEGRVTMSSPKLHGGNLGGPYPLYETYYTVDNYRGRLSSVASFHFNAPWVKEQPPKTVFRYECSGEAPLDILLMANDYQRVLPSIQGGTNVTRNLLGNWNGALGTQSRPIPNDLSPSGLHLASLALDDFRELGELDLQLNHPGVRDAGHSTRRVRQGVRPTRSANSAATENR